MSSKLKSAAEVKPYEPGNPNSCLDLNFDYTKLTGEEFKRYNDYLEEVCPELGIHEHTNRGFDFVLCRAKPVFKERYPGIPNSPIDLIGIELKTDPQTQTAVKHKTRIPFRHARTHNAQIENEHSRTGHGSYYLLVKPDLSI
jgi:hypothetical protein